MTINVTRSSMPTYEEYSEEIKSLWDSCWLTNSGVKHKQLEAELRAYLDTPNITLFTNGHLALEAIFAAMNLSGEVITTPFTFISTTHAIARCGMTPVFCDIEPNHYTLDASQLERLITEKTTAIVPVHVYGHMCDVEKIQRIADKYKLSVIYDAAHVFSVTYKGVNSANFGDASMFSFHATKVFHTIEGGAVTYKNEELTPVLNNLKNFGIKNAEEVVYIGGNAKMNEFQAAMGICNLRHIDTEIAKRKTVVEHYTQRLSNTPGIKLCEPQPGVKSNYAYFPVVFDGYRYNRDEVFMKLKANNIIARKYFYPLTNSFECYTKQYGADPALTPVAGYIADRVLTLPLYADLALSDVDHICDIICDCSQPLLFREAQQSGISDNGSTPDILSKLPRFAHSDSAQRMG